MVAIRLGKLLDGLQQLDRRLGIMEQFIERSNLLKTWRQSGCIAGSSLGQIQLHRRGQLVFENCGQFIRTPDASGNLINLQQRSQALWLSLQIILARVTHSTTYTQLSLRNLPVDPAQGDSLNRGLRGLPGRRMNLKTAIEPQISDHGRR